MIVVDASVAASWLLGDESDERAAATLAALAEAPGVVPQIWHYEMRNILLVANRRQRISAVEIEERLSALANLPIATDAAADLDVAFALARKHGLSFYDALYLELACRRRAMLASLDARLIAVAGSEGVAAAC